MLHNRLIVIGNENFLLVEYLYPYIRELFFQHTYILVRYHRHIAVPQEPVGFEIIHRRTVENNARRGDIQLIDYSSCHCNAAPRGSSEQSSAITELVNGTDIIVCDVLFIVQQCTVKVGHYQYVFKIHTFLRLFRNSVK